MLPVVASRRRFSPARLLTFIVANLVWLAPLFLAPATNAAAATDVFTVGTTADDATATPGNCPVNNAGGSGNCSLRDALQAADNDVSANPIVVDLSGLGNGTITLTSALPGITQSMTIQGPANPSLIVVSGANTYPVFGINIPTSASATVTVDGLTVAYAAGGVAVGAGAGTGYGSGLFVYPAGAGQTVTVNVGDPVIGAYSGDPNAGVGMIFHDNVSPTGGGGAITSEATTNILNSTFYNNSTVANGGAVYNNGTMNVTASTLYSNIAPQGSAIYNEASNGGILNISDSTVANNTASGSGAIYIQAGTVTIHDSTFSGNEPDNGGSIANAGTLTVTDSVFAENNTSPSDDQCTGTGCPVNPQTTPDASGNLQDTFANLKLSSLGAHGGPTWTLVPQSASAATCGGTTAGALTVSGGALTTDQRGFPLDSCPVGKVDSGSVQLGAKLVVTTTADSDHGGVCGATCSLRDAINAANTAGQGDIDATGVSGTITLTSELPEVNAGDNDAVINITGPSGAALIVNGNNKNRILINNGTLSISNITFEGGNSAATSSGDDPTGAGAILNAATLSLTNTVFTGNTASQNGGAIYSTGTSSLTVDQSTFSGNTVSTASGNGGAIDAAGPFTITNSTFSGNSAFQGAGVYNETDAASSISYSTFANNTNAETGSLFTSSHSTMTVRNTTFAGNTDGGGGGSGLYLSGGAITTQNSLFDTSTACFTTGSPVCPTSGTAGNVVAPTNLNTGVAGLSSLGSYGGPTQTVLPLPGSSAICGGLAADISSGATTDQRGFSNAVPGAYGCANPDSGAVQTNYSAVAFNATSYTGSVNVGGSTPPMLVDFTESGNAVAITPLPIATGGAAGAPTAGTTATTTATSGGFTGASFGNLTFGATGIATVSENLTVVGADVISAGPYNFTIGAGGTTAVVVTDAAPSAATVINNVANTETLAATVTHSGTPVAEGYLTFTICGGTYPTCTAVGTANGPLAVNGSGTATTPYTIPINTTAGTYYILAHYTDPGGTYATTDGHNQNIVVNNALAAATAIPTTTLTKNVAATPFTPVTASGGIPPYTFSIVAPPALPTNLAIAGTTGQISGTPNVASGATVYTVKVTDSEGTAATATATFTLQVNAPAITITPTTLTAATVGVAYTPTVTLVGAGGTAPYSFAVTTGALPAGMTLSSAGSLSGTPTAGGTFSFTVTATDANLNTGTQAYTWTVNAPTIVVLPAAGTLNATSNITYSQTFTASGGTPVYTWTETGALPTGITFNAATATLSGKTAVAGSFPISIKATDSSTGTGPYSQTNAYTLVVGAPTITITPTTLTAATAGVTFTQQLTASGGATPYTYAVTTGALPAGVTLSTAGLISGKPTAAGTFSFTVTATDNNTNTGVQAYTWTVNGPTLSMLPAAGTLNATVAAAYSQIFTASGGNTPYTFTETGTLPAGITWNAATATLSGTPTEAGSFPISIKAADSTTGTGSPFSVTNAYTLTVAGPTIAVTPAAGALTAATAGVAYTTVTFGASGGTAPYTFSLASGAVPAGMTFNAAAGTLSGTPTAVGSFSFSVKATDSTTGTGAPFSTTNAYTLTVNPPVLGLLPAAGTLTAAAETAYSQTFTASGGNTPYTFTETGTLPTGITWNAATATLSGTATQSGSFPISIKVTDSTTGTGSPFSVTNAYTLNVTAPTITLSPATLTAATDGTAYTATLTATGGVGPYTFTVTTGALPAGLTLATNGGLSGTPTAAGTFTFTVTGKDADNFTGAKAYTLTVNGPTITLLPPAGTLTAPGEVAYTQTFTATGGVTPYTFTETGTLPTGITWNAATATLSGTPTQGGSFPITIKVTDSSTGTGAPFSATNAYTLTVNGPTITVTPATLTAASIAAAYTATFNATGGTSPYTFSVTTGALPAGLNLSSAGSLTGTPTAAGTFNFTVTAKDTNNFTGATAYTLTVNAATIALLPAAGTLNATAEAAFTQAFTASGGTSPYTYTETGALPAGITWNAATGTLSGTATAAGSFPISIKATDSSTGTGAPFSATNNYTLVVAAPAITVAPATLTAASVATAYTATFTATGGVAPYTFSVSAGALPAGLTLATSGALTGTPAAGGTFTFTVTAKDTDNFTGSTAYTLTVNAPTIALLPAAGTLTATAEAAYTQTFTASGGTAPYTYTETGTLPAGVTFNNTTGVLSGTPTVSGSFPITVKATDSSTGSGPYSSAAVAYTLSVGTATVTINWANPAAITYGTTLAGVLDATATYSGNPVAGTFTYTATLTGGSATPVTAATVLAAGSYTLTASFTPTNTAYGTPTPKSVPLTVNQAQPTITWAPTATLQYGTSLNGLLNATASFGGNSVAGSFAYTATITGGTAVVVTNATVLAEGTYTLAVTFTPTDATDYKNATATAPLTVTGQTLTVTANNATKVYGTANPSFTGTVTGAVNGDTFTESFSTTATTTSNVGTYPIVPSVTGANISDYTVVVDDGTLTVTQAGTTTTLTASGNTVNPGSSVTLTATVASATTGSPTGTVTFYDGSTSLGTGTLAAGAGGDVATLSTSALLSGSHTITAVYGGDTNFTASSTTSSITITVEPLGLTLSANPASLSGKTGDTFNYTLAVAPAFAGTPYPGTVTFAATGGPAGAVIYFTPSSLAANAGPQSVTMSVGTSLSSAAVRPSSSGRTLVPVALAFLLLPFAGTRRMRRNGQRLARFVCLLLLALGGVVATTALSGCGSSTGGSNHNGNGTQYTITVTATSGSVSQNTTVMLTLQ